MVSTIRGEPQTRALVHPLPRTEAQCAAIDLVVGWSADDIGQVGTMLDDPEAEWYSACAVSEHPLLRRVAATHPGLPASLVKRLAADSDPHVRHLLAYNHPLAPAELLLEAFIAGSRQRPYLLKLPGMPRTGLVTLLHHEDPGVRALAAADVTLDEPPAVMLADRDVRVRQAAAANPLLPLELITELLDDADLAEAAAANPGLPEEHLHALLDRANIPRLN